MKFHSKRLYGYFSLNKTKKVLLPVTLERFDNTTNITDRLVGPKGWTEYKTSSMTQEPRLHDCSPEPIYTKRLPREISLRELGGVLHVSSNPSVIQRRIKDKMLNLFAEGN